MITSNDLGTTHPNAHCKSHSEWLSAFLSLILYYSVGMVNNSVSLNIYLQFAVHVWGVTVLCSSLQPLLLQFQKFCAHLATLLSWVEHFHGNSDLHQSETSLSEFKIAGRVVLFPEKNKIHFY